MAQYRRTLELGQDLITWTFDPLESKNGHLNLNRLNAVVKRYYVNLYGERPPVNSILPSVPIGSWPSGTSLRRRPRLIKPAN